MRLLVCEIARHIDIKYPCQCCAVDQYPSKYHSQFLLDTSSNPVTCNIRIIVVRTVNIIIYGPLSKPSHAISI